MAYVNSWLYFCVVVCRSLLQLAIFARMCFAKKLTIIKFDSWLSFNDYAYVFLWGF